MEQGELAVGGLNAAPAGGPVDGVVADDEGHRAGVVSDEPVEEAEEHFGGQPSRERGEPQLAARVTAEIMLTEWRRPVAVTTGVWPIGAHLVPL
ncbi:MAG TPA: hypothetical protein VKP69_33930 [Isosphaeraceae bacterium]|nr:hypothetical protein [Isosphaeraceae bacterium]